MDTPIAIGAKTPTFALLAVEGGAITSANLGKAAYALIFYPGDDTPTCTNELRDFSILFDKFQKCHVRLIGISRDSLASHAKFAAKHALKVELATDSDGRAVEAFGAWGGKQMFGRRYMGILRSTVLVAGGRVRGLWRVKRIAGHASEVLRAAQALAVD
jgi:thioredoxin-dependent peroxiredoxin